MSKTKKQPYSNKKMMDLKPSWSFLFNYIWLALELLLIVWLCTAFATNSITVTLSLIGFAGLYFWLNFTEHTRIQVIFILFLAVIWSFKWDVQTSLINSYILVTLLVAYGVYRIHKTQMTISRQQVFVKYPGGQEGEKPEWRSDVRYTQTLPGKLFNFGSIYIPIAESREPARALLPKRNEDLNTIKLDGINNPAAVVEDLKKRFGNE
jgi:hypothetical protein